MPSRRTAALLLISGLSLLAGCTAHKGGHESYLARRGIAVPSMEEIPHCRGYGCRYVDHTRLSAADWRDIAKTLHGAADAEAERTALKETMAVFERKIGRLTGTEADRAGTYVRWGDFQHDCVDESVNTTIYLSLLRQKGLLRFHDVEKPESRLPLLGGGFGPHQTAVIINPATQERFAVDTWFYDNGQPAEVIPMDDWFYGWHPNR